MLTPAGPIIRGPGVRRQSSMLLSRVRLWQGKAGAECQFKGCKCGPNGPALTAVEIDLYGLNQALALGLACVLLAHMVEASLQEFTPRHTSA